MDGPVKDRWVGSTLGRGRYTIRTKLGEGGMGSVYLAWDANLQTEVVVKFPHATHQEDPEATERFAREASSLVKLSHPHIVKILDFGEQAGQPYAVMQFLSGGSLGSRQGAEGQPPKKLPAESLKDWLPSVAKALDFVHAQGYLHRDVKPANILFDPYGNAFLSDFGITKFAIARQAADSQKGRTGTGIVLGTPEYMAPEVILGQPADGRLDQYGLAVAVYEMLAGRRPFEDATATAVLVQHTAQQPPDVRTFNGDISPALAAVIRQALAKEPAKRFPNCVAFADAAIAAISAHPIALNERVKLRCPACQKSLKVERKLQGKTVSCPACQATLRVSDDLREVTLAAGEGQPDRLRSGTRAVVVGDLWKDAGQEVPDELPVETDKEASRHPEDFWETDDDSIPLAGSSPTQSFGVAGIPTQSSHMQPRKRTSTKSKLGPRAKATPAKQNKLVTVIVSSSLAVLLLLCVIGYFVFTGVRSARRETKPPEPDTSAQANHDPSPFLRRTAPEIPRSPNNQTTRVKSPSPIAAPQPADFARADPGPSPPPNPAIYDITVSPATARLSVDNSAVEVTGSGPQRRVMVSDPRAVPSITLSVAADGYEDLQRELKPQPGLNSSLGLALAAVKPIEPRPSSQELSQGTDAPQIEGPDAFDGDRPGKVRVDNGLKTMLVWIPPGHFTMGSPADREHRQNEGPVAVTLTRGFWLGTYEVTQSEWRHVMQTAPWRHELDVQEGDEYPASYVSWNDAAEFCTKLTNDEHRAGRLPSSWQYSMPSEAQWEYACRAGTTTPFNFGKAVSQLPENAWFAKNASNRHEGYAHKVGGMNANLWGLHDVHGNVSEWCRDSYTQTLPGGTDPEVVAGGSQRVLRGGGWRSNYDDCRSATRNRATPTARSPAWGFRIAAVKRSDLPAVSKQARLSESLKTSQAVNELVLRSHNMLKSSDFNGARKTLEKASNMDQGSIVADCTLGLLLSISSPDKRSPKLAEQRFRIALRRSPNDVATLNNLALADIHLRKYADAIRCLREASHKSPDSEEVLHNLGRFVAEARSGKIHPPAPVLAEAAAIYAKRAAAKPAGQANSGTGWLYIPIKDQPTLPLGGNDIYDDRCCTACNGRAHIRCPHCSGGSVSDDQVQSGVIRTPLGNVSYADTATVQRRCTFCGGTGYIHCPFCSNGYDRSGR